MQHLNCQREICNGWCNIKNAAEKYRPHRTQQDHTFPSFFNSLYLFPFSPHSVLSKVLLTRKNLDYHVAFCQRNVLSLTAVTICEITFIFVVIHLRVVTQIKRRLFLQSALTLQISFHIIISSLFATPSQNWRSRRLLFASLALRWSGTAPPRPNGAKQSDLGSYKQEWTLGADTRGAEHHITLKAAYKILVVQRVFLTEQP